MKLKLLLIVIGICSLSCTENTRAKKFGGTMTVDLPPNTKLLNVTWKEGEMWYLCRPMREQEAPENYTFQEKSGLGIMEGKVIFTESK